MFPLWGSCGQCHCDRQCTILFGHVFNSPSRHLEDPLGHMINLCLTFWGAAKLFSKVSALFYSPTRKARGFKFHHIFANTWYFLVCFFFFLTAILVGMKWCLIVVLTSISLMTNNVENLCLCLLAICISSLEKCLFKSFVPF